MLTMKKVPMFGATTHNVKRLYETAFPVEQRVPFWSLRLHSNMNGMEIVAYYDEDVFCGFACLLATEKAVYLYYIAVADGQRKKGYGTQILDDLKQRYPEKTIALDIEARDPRANDNEKRAARRAFYLKNGFKASGFGFKDGGLFEIMVFGEKLEEPKAYAALIDRLAFGLTHTNVRPMSEVKSKSRK